MKRALRTLRLLAGTLLIVMGVLVISPAAHAAPISYGSVVLTIFFGNFTVGDEQSRF